MLSLALNFIADSKYLSKNTSETYLSAIKQFIEFNPKELSLIDNTIVKEWCVSLRQNNLSERTVRVKMSALKTFFDYCVEEGIIPKNPIIRFEPLPVEENSHAALTNKELWLLKEEAKNNVRDRAIIEMLYSTGLRVSNLCSLMISQISLQERTIRVVSLKNLKPGFILFSLECCQRLKEYLKTRTDTNQYLFISRRYQPFTRQGVWKIIKKYAKKAGLRDNVCPHSLRHTLGVNLYQKGMSTPFIMRQLIHLNPDSTSIYIKSSPETRLKNFDKFN